MHDPIVQRKLLAGKLIPCVVSKDSIRPRQHIVVFAYSMQRHEAEIVVQGLFQEFRRTPHGEDIVLTHLPDDDEVVTDSLAHRGVEEAMAHPGAMELDATTGLILPGDMVQKRDHINEDELVVMRLEPMFMFADGKRYSDRHAEDNIQSRTWRKLPRQ